MVEMNFMLFGTIPWQTSGKSDTNRPHDGACLDRTGYRLGPAANYGPGFRLTRSGWRKTGIFEPSTPFQFLADTP
jgi:hypothetical protein